MDNATPWLDNDGGFIAGIYEMPERTYRPLNALNWSRVKAASLKSLAACKRAADDAEAGKSSDTAGRAHNRLIHCLTLDPDAAGSDFVLSPYPKFTTKVARQWRDDQIASGFTPIAPSKWEEAAKAATTILQHARAAREIGAGLCEHVALWLQRVILPDGEIVERWCKAKLDVLRLTSAGIVVTDLKGASSVDPNGFARLDLARNGYHGQAAFYSNGARQALLQSGKVADDSNAARILWPQWIAHHEGTGQVAVIIAATQNEIDDGLAPWEPSRMMRDGTALWQDAIGKYVGAQISGEWPQALDEDRAHAPDRWSEFAPGADLQTWDEMSADGDGGTDVST